MSIGKRLYPWVGQNIPTPLQKPRTETVLPGADLECEFGHEGLGSSQASPSISKLSSRDVTTSRGGVNLYSSRSGSPMEVQDCPGYTMDNSMDMNGANNQAGRETEVCLGAISDCQVACPNGFGLDRACFSRITQTTSLEKMFPIISKRNYFVLQHSTGKRFGILDSYTTRTLKTIQIIGACRFQAILSSGQGNKPSENGFQKQTKNLIAISVNVYGLSTQSQAIGDSLEKNGNFLQHPDMVDLTIDYINPQYAVTSMTSKVLNNFIGASCKPTLNAETVSFEVEKILNSLDVVDEDIDIEQTHQVMTPLRSYQNAAIKFIAQRELPPEISHLKRLSSAVSSYTAREATDDHLSSRAGLLADEVGLGKTLTMLSAIINSSKDAYDFSFSREPDHLDHLSLQRIRATLIVVPSAQLIQVWKDEIECHIVPGSLQVADFLGKARPREKEEFAKLDLVFTTYSTLAHDLQKHRLLYEFSWFRVVLDEAHWIRNQSTRWFRSVNELRAERRWCLTATPIHNSLDDLGALVRFLKIRPFHEKSPRLAFRQYLVGTTPLSSDDPYQKLREFLGNICLRRRREKNSCLAVKYHRLELRMSQQERSLYDTVFAKTKFDMNEQVNKLPVAQRYVKLFALLLRLRLVCNLGIDNQELDSAPIQYLDSTTQRYATSSASVDLSCDSCRRLDIPDDEEEESFCSACGRQLQYGSQTASLNDNDGLDNDLKIDCGRVSRRKLESVESFLTFEGSTKLLAVRDLLNENSPETKSVIFSCWTRTLDALGALLDAKQIPFVRIDGGTSYAERKKRLADFQNTNGISALLMTFGTGAVGLNLACASQIHILEPQWNPMVEEQAIGRALRLDQKREVTVIHYVMEDTIEKNIIDKQQEKKKLAKFAFSGGSETTMNEKLANLESALQ